MAVLNVIPETQVNLIDLRDTINAFGGSASNYLPTFFQNNDMNMWARFKFTIVNGRPFVDDAKRWQGDDGMCGLNIPEFSSPSAMRAALTGGSDKWSYRPPQGGETQPMRLGDARKYMYTAVCPIGSMESNVILRSTTGGYEFDINVEVVVQSSDLNLTLNDLSIRGVKFSQMYLGVYMLPKSGSGYYWGSSSTPIGTNGELTMTLKGTSGTLGEFNAYVFLATSSQVGQERSGYFYGLNKTAQTVTIKSASTQHLLTALCMWHADGKGFDYSIHIKNNTTSQQTYSGIKVYIGQRTSVQNAPNNVLSWSTSPSSVTVAANGSTTISGTITTTRNQAYDYVCGAGCTTPSVSPTYGDMDEQAPEG